MGKFMPPCPPPGAVGLPTKLTDRSAHGSHRGHTGTGPPVIGVKQPERNRADRPLPQQPGVLGCQNAPISRTHLAKAGCLPWCQRGNSSRFMLE